MQRPEWASAPAFSFSTTGLYDPNEVTLLLSLLDLRRKYYGDGVVAVDCGANLGVHTIEWAKHMTGWGVVLAFEAQERIYYALAGNIAINNCFNARAINAAVSNRAGHDENTEAELPRQCELRQPRTEEARQHRIHRPSDRLFRRQNGRRADRQSRFVQFPRLDPDQDRRRGHGAGGAWRAAPNASASHRPILLVEAFKTDKGACSAWLENLGYTVVPGRH